MVKITWATNHSTAQIYSSGIELALCSDDNKQIGTFVYCKDFFQDAIIVSIHGGICKIHGYLYDPKIMPKTPSENLKVLIAHAGNNEFSKNISAIPDFLNQVEKILDLQKTTIEECENPPEKYKNGIYLMVADKKWMLAPPLLSMWTLLARNGIRHTTGNNWEDTVKGIIDGKILPAQKNDATFLKYAKPGIDLVLTKGIKFLFGENQVENYPVDKGGYIMHHHSGAVSYGSCKAREHFPKWVYPAEATNPPSVCFA